MRSTSIFPGGPPRRDNDPLTDAAEVRAARRILQRARTGRLRNVDYGGVLADPLGPEQFDSHAEYEAARDLEQWGDDPFGED